MWSQGLGFTLVERLDLEVRQRGLCNILAHELQMTNRSGVQLK